MALVRAHYQSSLEECVQRPKCASLCARFDLAVLLSVLEERTSFLTSVCAPGSDHSATVATTTILFESAPLQAELAPKLSALNENEPDILVISNGVVDANSATALNSYTVCFSPSFTPSRCSSLLSICYSQCCDGYAHD